jgi:transposase
MSTTTVETVVSRPDPEVRAPIRSYAPKYKLAVLGEIDAAQTRGEIGEIMRREGLYSSLISEWRKQRERGALEAMSGRRRGRKSDPVAAENARLRERVSKLEAELATAGELIEAQGKVSALLQQISRRSAEQQ